MEEYEIVGPDGKTYGVKANSEAEAGQILAADMQAFSASQQRQRSFPEGSQTFPIEQTGGTLYRTPGGEVGYVDPNYSTTDPQIIQRIQMGEDPQQIFKRETMESVVERFPVASRVATAIQGLPFVGTYIDELGASPESTQAIRTMQQSMEETRPIESALLEAGTGIATTAPLGGIIPGYAQTKFGRAAERAVQAGLFGGIEGAVSGYGAGETPEEKMRMAKERGLFGTMFGTPLGALGGMGEAIYESARRIDVGALARELGISNDAATILVKLGAEGAPQNVIDANLSRMGNTARLANAGPASKALLDIVQASSPQAIEGVQTGVRQAGREVRSEFDAFLNNTFGQPAIGPKQIFRDAAQASAPQRDEAYQKAYSTLINYSSKEGEKLLDALNTIPADLMDQASKRANDLMQIDELVVPQIKTGVRDGKTVIENAPTVIQIDYLKRALGQIISNNTDSITGKLSADGQMAQKLYRRISTAAGNAAPSYRKAVQLGLDNIQEENAIRLVNSFNQAPVEDFVNLFSQAQGKSRDQLKTSMRRMFRTNLDTIIGDARSTVQNPDATENQVNAAVKIFKDYTTPNALRKLALFLPRTEIDKFREQMRRVAEQLDLQAKTARGSQTAIREQGRRLVEEVASPTFMESVTSGEGPQAIKTAMQAFLGPIGDSRRVDQILDQVGRQLLARRGDAEARRIAGIMRKIRDNESITREEAQIAGQVLQSRLRSFAYEPAQQVMVNTEQ